MYIIFLHGNTVSTKIYSTAKFYISISYQKDLLSIDTRIFTPSIEIHKKKTPVITTGVFLFVYQYFFFVFF